jgi:8-oxo-dGTP diphosphatase
LTTKFGIHGTETPINGVPEKHPKKKDMRPKTPLVAVDIIIEYGGGIVLIERRNPPYGWALPGGFVDEGESLEEAAVREAKEETSLEVTLRELLYVYSKPSRDPRGHTVSPVFIGCGEGDLKAADDAKGSGIFFPNSLPLEIAFDHREIIQDYYTFVRSGQRPAPMVDKAK